MTNFIDNLVQRSAGVSSTVTVQPAFVPSFPPHMGVTPGAGMALLDAAMPGLSPVETASAEAPAESVSRGLPTMETRSSPLEPSPLKPSADAMDAPIPEREPAAALPAAPLAAAFSIERSDLVSQVTTPGEPVPVRSPAPESSEPPVAPTPAEDAVVPSPVVLHETAEPIVEPLERSLETSPPMPSPPPALEEPARLEPRVAPIPTRSDATPAPPISASPEPQAETAVDATPRPPIIETLAPPADTAREPIVERLERSLETPPLPHEPVVPSPTALDDAARSATQVVLAPQASTTPVMQPALDAPGPEDLPKIEPASPRMTTQSHPTIRPSSEPPLRFPIAGGRRATAPERPAIHIRIGTIEVRATMPPPAPPPPVRAPTPRGFEEYVRVRNYVNWDNTEG